jgi:GT2 family glycosyltransferase
VLISVCVPVFNGQRFLRQAFDSVLSQNYKYYELVISDDGSTDDSWEIIKEYESKFTVKTILIKSDNLGISANCNLLAHKANGQYLKFLFQDDTLEDNALENFISKVSKYDNVTLAFSDRSILFEDRSKKECQDIFNGCRNLAENWSDINEFQTGAKLLEDPNLLISPINKVGEPSNTLILRSAFHESGGFDPNISQLLDIDLWFRLMALGNVVYIDENLSKFRIHNSQQSVLNAINIDISDDFLKLYSKILTSNIFNSLSDNFRKRIFESYKYLLLKDPLKNERKEYLETINHLKKRIIFIEGTFAWKFRKFLMKFYYLFNYRKKKKRPRNTCNQIYSSLSFTSFARIRFRSNSTPRVSIIIPFFNEYEITWLCLKSIELNCDDYRDYEVILVDDCSKKNSDFYNSVSGVQVLRNTTNLGFLSSCNKAARSANGEFIVFLNNDTQVQKNWLGNLINVFNNNKEAGAVGSKLIFPDNSLQEAGGIIWNDATGCNYGKGNDPNLPQYNFMRRVDYCSGSSFAIKKILFFKLGGFDEKYSPAYFEDTDLCFKIRENGGIVLYQPTSVVMHLEGASCGKSELSGIKSFQKKNRDKFFATWRKIPR